MACQFKKKKKKHILSKCWPASAADSLVRRIGITGAGWREHLCNANAGAGRGNTAGSPTSTQRCLQMLRWDEEEGSCTPARAPTHHPVQGDPSELPETLWRGGCAPGPTTQLSGCKFPLAEHWSNWAWWHRTGVEGLRAAAPHPLPSPASGSPQDSGCSEAFPSRSKQHFLTSCTSTPTAPSYQKLPFYAQKTPRAGADWVLRCG